MPLYLDCEFNGYRGKLISLALYNPNGDHFYEVADYKFYWEPIEPWVIANVLPKLNKEPLDEPYFGLKLREYLLKYPYDTIYSDWPEDFSLLLQLLCGPRGLKYVHTLKFELITVEEKAENLNKHNALNDALTLYLDHTWPKEKDNG